MLPVFVYGTLRAGSWNHDAWLAPWLDTTVPAVSATLAHHALHHLDGLPAVTPRRGSSVLGELVWLRPDVADEALAVLDDFEGVPLREYERVVVRVVGGTRAWIWMAGPQVAPRLGDHTEVPTGDWLTVPAP